MRQHLLTNRLYRASSSAKGVLCSRFQGWQQLASGQCVSIQGRHDGCISASSLVRFPWCRIGVPRPRVPSGGSGAGVTANRDRLAFSTSRFSAQFEGQGFGNRPSRCSCGSGSPPPECCRASHIPMWRGSKSLGAEPILRCQPASPGSARPRVQVHRGAPVEGGSVVSAFRELDMVAVSLKRHDQIGPNSGSSSLTRPVPFTTVSVQCCVSGASAKTGPHRSTPAASASGITD